MELTRTQSDSVEHIDWQTKNLEAVAIALERVGLTDLANEMKEYIVSIRNGLRTIRYETK